MSELANTQIPKPANEQDFEAANEVLWRCILTDGTVKTHGRRGQKQDGVDLTGLRDNDPERIVGVQAKQKGHGKQLTENEVRDEVDMAMRYDPPLSEYIIVTTAPDDATLDKLARTLSQTKSKGRDKPIIISVMGWGTMEREIRRHTNALNAFDPSHTPHGDLILRRVDEIPSETLTALEPQLNDIQFQLQQIVAANGSGDKYATALDKQVDDIVKLLDSDPQTALSLLVSLNERLDDATPKRLHYRVHANIAACQFTLGDEDVAADGFIAAYDLDPEHPRASANKSLGLLIKQDLNSLKEFALQSLGETPNNGAVAAYLVQGLIVDSSVDDPRDLVPEGAQDTPEFKLSYVRWLMDRGEPGAWREQVSAEYVRNPDFEGIAEHYASALLEKTLEHTGFEFGRELTQAERTEVSQSADLYEAVWQDMRAPDHFLRGEPISTPLNLMTAYRLLNEGSEAIRVGKEAMELFPDNEDVRNRLAASLMEVGDTNKAKELVSDLPVNAVTVMIRFNIYMSSSMWTDVDQLVAEHLDLFPPEEKSVAITARTLAAVESAPFEKREALLTAHQGRDEDDCRVNIMLSQCARHHGLAELADHFYHIGLQALDSEETRFADRSMAAQESMSREETGNAARILDGYVALDRDSPELRLLVKAVSHDYPIRERAARVFSDISASVRKTPFYQRMEGVYHINRGQPNDAIPLFSETLDSDPHLSNLMGLIGAHLRTKNFNAVRSLLRNQAFDELRGHALDKMNYCQILLEYGHPKRALDLGYETLLSAYDQPDVVMKYFGLFLMQSKKLRLTDEPAVGPGMSVQMTDQDDTIYSALVDEVGDRPWGNAVASSNSFVSCSVGLSVGETFEWTTALGVTEIWTIKQVKPVCLEAYHFLTNTFNQRFPQATGFATLKMRDGDIQPTLDQVKRHSEAVRQQIELYTVHGVPMAIAAGGQPGAVLGFSELLTDMGEKVRTCQGVQAERNAAFDFIQQNGQNGAVLDALTAWRASELDVFEVLQSQLGTLSMPRSEINAIRALVEEQDNAYDGEQMSISYRDGQYYRTIISPEDRAKNLGVLKKRLSKIEAACQIEPVVIPDLLPEAGELLASISSGDVLAPLVLAGTERLLLCEDLKIREIGAAVFKNRGVWLQSVLLNARLAGEYALDDYSDALVLLAARQHDSVSVSSETLYSVYQRDASAELVRLQALCEYVGTRNAEPTSHIGLATDFINQIWNVSPVDHQKRCRATSIVLRAVLLRHRGKEWRFWAAAIISNLPSRPKKYFTEWCKGHFLPFEHVLAALRS